MTASVMHGRREVTREASGNSGRQYRSMPNVPTLSRTPTSSTAPAGGDSAAASGSQVWNGKSGALIANAMKKPRNSHRCVVSLMSTPSRSVNRNACGGDDHVQPDHSGEHEQPAEQAVEQELHRGVRPLRAAVAADEEVHRDEHRLEEHVEEEDVRRREDADHHRLEEQQSARSRP